MESARMGGVKAPGSWGLVLLQGVVALIIGLFLVFTPADSIVVLVTLVGAYWLVAGILSIVRIFTGTTRLNWFWALALGVLGIVAGMAVLAQPLFGTVVVVTTLIILLGIDGVIMGVVNVGRAIAGDGWECALLGIVDFIIGVILLSKPLVAASILPIVLGAFAVVGGIILIFASFSVRGAEKRPPTGIQRAA